MSDILLKQSGRLVSVLFANGSSLTDQLAEQITTELTYYEKSYSPWAGVNFEPKTLCVNTNNIISCGVGFTQRIVKLLKQNGYKVSISKNVYDYDTYKFDWSMLPENFEFRHRQEEFLLKVASAPYGTIQAVTASGKSFSQRLMCQLGRYKRILYVTKSTDIADQTYDSLIKVIPGVNRVCGGSKVIPDARVVVANADSLHKVDRDFDEVMLDELHELATDKYVGQLYEFKKAKMFGFTASLERPDKRHIELEGLCGPVIFKLDYQEALDNKMVNAVDVEWLVPDIVHDPGAQFMPGADRDRASVWRNEARNQLIADRVKQIPANVQTLVVAKTVEHVYALKQLLPDFEVVYAPKSDDDERMEELRQEGLIPEEAKLMTKQKRKDLRHAFEVGKLKKVICNYVWSTGVDFRELSVLVRADASGESTKNTQIPGRAVRIMEGKGKSLIIDVWDAFSTPLLVRSRARKKAYETNGWPQIWPEAKAKEVTRGKSGASLHKKL